MRGERNKQMKMAGMNKGIYLFSNLAPIGGGGAFLDIPII